MFLGVEHRTYIHIAIVLVFFLLNILYLSAFLIPFKIRFRGSQKRIVLLAAGSRVLAVRPREERAFSPAKDTRPLSARGVQLPGHVNKTYAGVILAAFRRC